MLIIEIICRLESSKLANLVTGHWQTRMLESNLEFCPNIAGNPLGYGRVCRWARLDVKLCCVVKVRQCEFELPPCNGSERLDRNEPTRRANLQGDVAGAVVKLARITCASIMCRL